MFLSADVISLLLYCAQQLGVTLGVGAQTIMLVAYVMAMRDGVVDDKEAQFSRAVMRVLITGLTLIILSGLGIMALHFLAGESAVIFSQAFLFKWLLIIGVLVCTLFNNLPQHMMLGLAGGSWYALFVVHILAPVATWANLLTLYAVWMIGFGICWAIIVLATRGKGGIVQPKKEVNKILPPIIKTAPPVKPIVAAPKPPPPPTPPPPPPAPMPKLTVVAPPPINLPVLEQQHILQTLPQPEVNKPQSAAPVAPKPEENPWLPAIQVMPKEPPK